MPNKKQYDKDSNTAQLHVNSVVKQLVGNLVLLLGFRKLPVHDTSLVLQPGRDTSAQ